jgi:AraC-like DNA-binding protein
MSKAKSFVLNSEEQERLAQVKLLLDSASYQYESLQQLSHTHGMSLSKLKTGFKLLYGVSIYHYLLGLRIERGKHLLLETGLPVKAIAVDCGFSNSQHFITTFRKWVGVTPGGYRANHN